MKKALILSAALVALTASMASAQAINYSLTDCGTFGTTDIANTCTSNSGTAINSVGSVIPPAGVDHMVGMEAVIDAQTGAATLSPWWQLDGCHAGGMLLSADFTSFAVQNCTDYWGGAGTIVGGIDPVHSGPNRFRIKMACALPNEQAIDTSENYMFIMKIQKTKSVGTGSCAGCLDAVSLVLNEIRLVQPAGVGDFRIFTPGTRSYITYRGGIPNTPGATPTRNTTWGAIKGLYR